MATIIWDDVGSRIYETGISKGVFYDADGFGVAWNGLTSVEENQKNQIEPIYFDGLKINDIVTIGEYTATMKAFTYPDEFLPYEGVLQDDDFVSYTGQKSNRFGLSYQTKIGNDVEGTTFGYKIHVLYNLTAVPSQRTYNTLSLETEPLEFEWVITSVPETIPEFRPTSHVIFDSNKLDSYLFADIERLLYGSVYEDPQLLPLSDFVAFIQA